MADITKYAPINGGPFISDFKTHFSISRTKPTVVIAYLFLFFFIAFTIFLAFSPAPNNIFSSTNTSPPSPILSDDSYRSHFSSIFSYIFPNSSSSSPPTDTAKSQNNTLSQPNLDKDPLSAVQNQTKDEVGSHKDQVFKQNLTQSEESHSKYEDLGANHSAIVPTDSPEASNKTMNPSENSASAVKNVASNGEKGIAEDGALVKNLTYSPVKKKGNGSDIGRLNQGFDDLIKSLSNCDFYDGNWVRDESYPLYKPGSCSLIDEQFNCFLSGRPDNGYYKLKWQPKGCTLPRLNGSHMLELLRGKRLVFVGDSLNRNMWESLVCILRNSVKDRKKVYEASGRHHFRTEASYAFVFEDYKCTVEFFASPFLVQEWEVVDKNGTKKETLRLDLMSRDAEKYKEADMIVFNTGHWWTHEKTAKGRDYYQEGNHVYAELNVDEAFHKAIASWGRWIDAKINPRKSLVFFRGYSASHFSGGQWNSGGQCDNETEPITNDAYLSQYPSKMRVVEQVLKGTKTPVTYMNVTRMTDYRKDGHPSIYRKQHSFDLSIQDCSHWCLPGVPDTWNEILYAELMVKINEKRQTQRRA